MLRCSWCRNCTCKFVSTSLILVGFHTLTWKTKDKKRIIAFERLGTWAPKLQPVNNIFNPCFFFPWNEKTVRGHPSISTPPFSGTAPNGTMPFRSGTSRPAEAARPADATRDVEAAEADFFDWIFLFEKKKWVDYDLRKQFLLMIWWLGLFGGIFLYEVQETCIYDTCVKICLCISTYGNALLTLDTHISLHAVHILYIVRMFTQVSIDMFWSFFKPLWHRFSFKALKQTPGSPKYLEVDMVAHNQAER